VKTLRMIFNTADDDQWILSLRYPKDDINATEVETAMQTIVDNDVFVSGPVSIAGAEIVDRTVTELL
jgi:hypothetical protein